MPDVQHKRGSRSALDSLAGSSGLLPGQIYLITDEDRIAVALTSSTYATFLKQGEADGFAQKSGTPANNRIGVWTGADAIEGSTTLSWDDVLFLLQVAGTTTGVRMTTSGGTSDISMSGTTGFWTNYAGALAFYAATGDITLTANAGEVVMASPCVFKSYTVATLPSASAAGAGAMVYVTDERSGAVPAFSDGSNWRRVTDRDVASTPPPPPP